MSSTSADTSTGGGKRPAELHLHANAQSYVDVLAGEFRGRLLDDAYRAALLSRGDYQMIAENDVKAGLLLHSCQSASRVRTKLARRFLVGTCVAATIVTGSMLLISIDASGLRGALFTAWVASGVVLTLSTAFFITWASATLEGQRFARLYGIWPVSPSKQARLRLELIEEWGRFENLMRGVVRRKELDGDTATYDLSTIVSHYCNSTGTADHDVRSVLAVRNTLVHSSKQLSTRNIEDALRQLKALASHAESLTTMAD